MNIILVSSRLATARTLTITGRHLLMASVLMLAAVLSTAGAINYVALRYAAESRSSWVFTLFSRAISEDSERTQAYLRDNLDAMASRLGEMQAQLLRLDAVGERVARLAGFNPRELRFDQAPARGGAQTTLPGQPFSFTDLGRSLELVSRQVEDRIDKMGLLDSLLTIDSARKKLLPSVMPVEGGSFTSNYGWRIDPFSGARAFHEGVDFMADPGTPIVAAAAGVVVFSDWHPQYGNMVEVDHGNDLVTRYAHCARRLVQVGDVVQRGARIAEVGSTGRATGPHLHFEVRHQGVAQNPSRFLRMPG